MKRPNIAPGPWFLFQKPNGPVQIHTFASRRVCTMAGTPEDQREAAARAKAIAAMPDLLAALERIYEGAQMVDREIAKEALTKAGYKF